MPTWPVSIHSPTRGMPSSAAPIGKELRDLGTGCVLHKQRSRARISTSARQLGRGDLELAEPGRHFQPVVHDETRHPVTELPHDRAHCGAVSLTKHVDMPGQVHDRPADVARDECQRMVQLSR